MAQEADFPPVTPGVSVTMQLKSGAYYRVDEVTGEKYDVQHMLTPTSTRTSAANCRPS